MTEWFEKVCTRLNMSDKDTIKWSKGEYYLGLNNSLFICEDGEMTQYVDGDEAQEFHEWVCRLTEDDFNEICDNFFKALEKKDLESMHMGLAVFDELDNYPDIGTLEMRRRLKRIRETTDEESYKLHEEGLKDFIIFKNKLYISK